MWTREKQREYMLRWRQSHKEHIRKYEAKNKDKRNAQRRKRYRETGTEKKYLQQRRRENPELYRRYRRKWLQKNRERHVEAARIYTSNNPQKKQAQNFVGNRNLPLASECEVCPQHDKRRENLLHHHPDYDESSIYVTVCPSCHYYVRIRVD